MRLFFSILVISFLFIQDSWAGGRHYDVFKAKTDDLTVNDECETYKSRFFLQEEIRYFTVGLRGRGFQESIDLKRSEASTLWGALSPNSKSSARTSALKKINRDEDMLRYYDVLLEGRQDRGARYYSEGEILEILSYEYLPTSETFKKMLDKHFGDQPYTAEDYFITGGVTYYAKNRQVIGELDVIVGDSTTCSIFGIGEAKLGRGKGKAKDQLGRIRSFLRSL